MTRPDPKSITNFPLQNPRARIVCERGRLYVCERTYCWDSKSKTQTEDRIYIGRIIDGVYYTMAEYRRRFKRNGELRAVPGVYKRRKKRKQAQPATGSTAAGQAGAAGTTADTAEPAVQQEPEFFPLKTSRIGITPIFYMLARQCGLWEDFSKVWGEQTCAAVCSIACHWLLTAHNAAYLYKSWAENYALPFPTAMSANEISELFSYLAEKPDWQRAFFGARLARMPDHEIFSYDSTNIATKACAIADAQCGKSKEGGYRRQIGMSVLFGQTTGLPVMFRLFPGNISDVSTIVDLLTRVELIDENRVISAVLDRGYFSLDNIELCINAGQRALFAAKMSVSWVREAAEEIMPDLWDASSRLRGVEVWGKTVKKELVFNSGSRHTVWIHIFRDELKSHLSAGEFFSDLEEFESKWYSSSLESSQTRAALLKNEMLKYFLKPEGEPGECRLKRDNDAINEAIRYFGFFASVSTMECNAQEAIDSYRDRDSIEKCFKAGKSSVNMDCVRSHKEATMTGRFIVSFFALTVLSELRRRMNRPFFEDKANSEDQVRLPPLSEEMSYREMLNYLAGINVCYGRDRDEVRYMEVTQKQRQIARRLRCTGVYDVVPEYIRRRPSGDLPVEPTRM